MSLAISLMCTPYSVRVLYNISFLTESQPSWSAGMADVLSHCIPFRLHNLTNAKESVQQLLCRKWFVFCGDWFHGRRPGMQREGRHAWNFGYTAPLVIRDAVFWKIPRRSYTIHLRPDTSIRLCSSASLMCVSYAVLLPTLAYYTSNRNSNFDPKIRAIFSNYFSHHQWNTSRKCWLMFSINNTVPMMIDLLHCSIRLH